MNRRDFVQLSTAGLGLLAGRGISVANAQEAPKAKTDFQIACMTLPWSQFPLQRALEGIRSAGFRHVAWGTTHKEENGQTVPAMAPDATPQAARELGLRCRDMGLEPVMMFSNIYPDHKDAMEVFTQRIKQASAAGIPQVLTFGAVKGTPQELASTRAVWIERFKKLAPVARDHGVTIVLKPHGGNTATGAMTFDIVREVNDPNFKMNYDAGNVGWYAKVDSGTEIEQCAPLIRSFCIKDYRNFPKEITCGPGLGQVDHYRLLHPVAFTGLKMPLCCENIFAPYVQRPADPAGVDALAKRAREFLEIVIQGLHAA